MEYDEYLRKSQLEAHKLFLESLKQDDLLEIFKSHEYYFNYFVICYLNEAIKSRGVKNVDEAIKLFGTIESESSEVIRLRDFVVILYSLKVTYYTVQKIAFLEILDKYSLWLKNDLQSFDIDMRVQILYFIGLNSFIFEYFDKAESCFKECLSLFESCSNGVKDFIKYASLVLVLVAVERDNKQALKKYLFDVGKYIGRESEYLRHVTSIILDYGLRFAHINEQEEINSLNLRSYCAIHLPDSDPEVELALRRLRENFNFVAWLEAKYERTSMTEILKKDKKYLDDITMDYV
jgi:hypothetical protein